MMAFNMLHGCTKEWVSGQQNCRNFVPSERLYSYLAEQPRKYTHFRETDKNPHVLSVDDATRGAAMACELARMFDHEVTLFVNPFHVATGAPYFFTLLDEALDARTVETIKFVDILYDLRDRRTLRLFRLAAKKILWSLRYSDGILLVYRLCDELGVSQMEPKEHAQILRLKDLIHLRDIGVVIENHGWYHDEISYLGDHDFVKHVKQAQEWLSAELGIASRQYAIPFGITILSEERRKLISGPVWLAHPDLKEGHVGMGHWNRIEITSSLQVSG